MFPFPTNCRPIPYIEKTAFVTHSLAVMALAVFLASKTLGIHDQGIVILGVQSQEDYSYLTHAIMHRSWDHLIGNLLVLELAGPFVERWAESRTTKWAGKLLSRAANP